MTDYRAMTDADLRAAHERLVSRLLRAWQRKRDATAEWEALCDEFAACKLEETLRDVMPAARGEGMSERAYTAKAFDYPRTQLDCVLGIFPTAYDAKIACEHHAGQPLQWIKYDTRDSGPFSYADIYVGDRLAWAYYVHQRSKE